MTEERKQAEGITAEEFIRNKIRKKYSLSETSPMNSLGWYSINAEEALRWSHEFAALKVAEATKGTYPKGFTEWICKAIFKDLTEDDTYSLPAEFYKQKKTTDELLEYWKQNIQGK